MPKNSIKAGEVGYIISGIKDAREVKVGDTITQVNFPAKKLFKDLKRLNLWFLQVFILDTEDFEELRSSMENFN